MSPPGKIRPQSTRAHLMVAIGSALYFLILLLALYVMDRQVYTAEKMEIIRNNFLEIFSPPDSLNDEARRALYATPVSRRAEERVTLKNSLQQIVDGPTSIYNMWLSDENGNVIVEVSNPDKPVRLNTWQNNLFIREFSGRTSQNVTPVRTPYDDHIKSVGHLVGIYTSPVDVPAITSLTKRYRVYAAILIIGWIIAWLLIYYYLLRPVRNVTIQLDRDPGQTPTLIRNARGALESGYNELAASALLQSIEDTLNTAARASGHKLSRGGAIRRSLVLAGEGFGADHLRTAFIAGDGSVAEQYEWISPAAQASYSDNETPPLASISSENIEGESRLVAYDDHSGFTWLAPLATGSLQVDCRYADGREPSAQFHSYLVRACESLRAGFVAFQAYREQLFRERSEANISLSRNMGHDLTNIIATSKLELLGIKRILHGAAEGTTPTGQRAAILTESVSGLLESTRFMQEMVNIYRSFSYVKRPAYERRALVPLIEEFLQMFVPALSSHVSITSNLAPDLPPPIIEPRLLKLALFNVLQNALDAIKKSDPDSESGLVEVSLKMGAGGRYEITIADNGPGIRDESDRPLSADEVAAIFDYGYTTKGAGGEGLGLNWVQTIMTEFHDGGVRAQNNPTSGASITLWLRSMERKEARVGQKTGQGN